MSVLHRFVLLVAIFLPPTLCKETESPSPPKCLKHQWVYYKTGQKYIHIVFDKQTFDEAVTTCHQLGGNLLTVKDKQTETFVREYFDERPGQVKVSKTRVVYWLGLKSKTDPPDNSTFLWQDGTKLLKDDYSNWDWNPEPFHRCVAVTWMISEKWVTRQCVSQFPFLCEASEPCRALPGITINDRPPIVSNQTVWFKSEQSVDVTCKLQAVPDLVKLLKLTCVAGETEQGKVQTSRGGPKKRAAFTVDLNFRLGGLMCACVSRNKYENLEWVYAQVRFHVIPRFADDKNTTSAIHGFTVEEGTDFKHFLRVIAAPTPHSFDLTRGEGNDARRSRPVDSARFGVEVLDVRSDTITHTLVFRFFHPRPNDTGLYSLTIENYSNDNDDNEQDDDNDDDDDEGADDEEKKKVLTWTFHLEVLENDSNRNLEFVVGALVAVAILFIVYVIMIRKHTENRKMSQVDSSTVKSMDTTIDSSVVEGSLEITEERKAEQERQQRQERKEREEIQKRKENRERQRKMEISVSGDVFPTTKSKSIFGSTVV